MSHVAPINWSELKDSQFLLEDGCWSGCGGGFCCSQNHPDFDFRFMPSSGKGTTLIYWHDEYEWLSREGRVQPISESGPVRELRFDFGGPEPLRITNVACHHLGLCNGKLDKPLVCKLYPFLPVANVSGTIDKLIPLSIFDLTFDAIGTLSPCWVRTKYDAYLRRWQSASAPAAFRHPLYILYSQAASHFVDLYMKDRHPRLAGLTGKGFWRTWELLYLGGRLVNSDEWKRRVFDSYSAIKTVHGEFLGRG